MAACISSTSSVFHTPSLPLAPPTPSSAGESAQNWRSKMPPSCRLRLAIILGASPLTDHSLTSLSCEPVARMPAAAGHQSTADAASGCACTSQSALPPPPPLRTSKQRIMPSSLVTTRVLPLCGSQRTFSASAEMAKWRVASAARTSTTAAVRSKLPVASTGASLGCHCNVCTLSLWCRNACTEPSPPPLRSQSRTLSSADALASTLRWRLFQLSPITASV
mmetsp:Transcript_4089/g.10780  ORF Transcript_4089/g.10780 Transcript_4089/m.10780 type:complete len:221 (-) Transcript_4089:631-1293(-)